MLIYDLETDTIDFLLNWNNSQSSQQKYVASFETTWKEIKTVVAGHKTRELDR